MSNAPYANEEANSHGAKQCRCMRSSAHLVLLDCSVVFECHSIACDSLQDARHFVLLFDAILELANALRRNHLQRQNILVANPWSAAQVETVRTALALPALKMEHVTWEAEQEERGTRQTRAEFGMPSVTHPAELG